MKLSSLSRWAKFSIIGVVLLILVVGLRGCGGKKQVTKPSSATTTPALQGVELAPVTKPDSSATASVFQRIESAVTVIQKNLTDLTKGLADLTSRVKALENKPVLRSVGGAVKPSVAKAEKLAVPAAGVSKPPASSSPSSVTMVVDMAPVVDGLNGIAEAIKESTNPRQSSVSSPPIAEAEPEPSRQELLGPCTGWAQDPARHRRCRVWNQLP